MKRPETKKRRGGTINVARALWDDTTFRDSEMSQREAWIWLIVEASWKPRTVRVGSIELSLVRGQLAHSTRHLAKEWQWSEARVRRYLDMLENRRMVERVTDAGITVLSICNYDIYQNAGRDGDAPADETPTQERRTSDANHKKGERRGKIHGGGSDAPQLPAVIADPAPTLREQILSAMKVDPVSGVSPDGRSMHLGNRADMEIVDQIWTGKLELPPESILAVVAETMERKTDGWPSTFRYFNRAMEREASRRATLTDYAKPTENSHDRQAQPARPDRRAAAADDALRNRILGAATNRGPSGKDISFG